MGIWVQQMKNNVTMKTSRCAVFAIAFLNGFVCTNEHQKHETGVIVKDEGNHSVKKKEKKTKQELSRSPEDHRLYNKLSKIEIDDTPDSELPFDIQKQLDDLSKKMKTVQKQIDKVGTSCASSKSHTTMEKNGGESSSCKSLKSLKAEMGKIQTEYSRLISPHINWQARKR